MEEKDIKTCESENTSETSAKESETEKYSPDQQAEARAQDKAVEEFWRDKYAKSRIRSIEMRNMIFEALSLEDKNQTPRKQTFKMYGYCGCVYDLRMIVEHLAIKYGLVSKVFDLPNGAWGTPGPIMYYASNSNFNDAEDKIFGEEFHQLVFHNVISPGAPNSYGASLPYFHVTEYGLSCIKQRDILPHDPEGYLAKLNACSVDDWERFYMTEALTCYNATAYSSALIMLGLLGEYITEKLIVSLQGFLGKQEPSRCSSFTKKIKLKQKISTKHSVYEKELDTLEKLKNTSGQPKYQELTDLNAKFDTSAKSIYSTYVRLTRNELSHPNGIRIERMECLTMFVCFIKYLEVQHDYLDYFARNS